MELEGDLVGVSIGQSDVGAVVRAVGSAHDHEGALSRHFTGGLAGDNIVNRHVGDPVAGAKAQNAGVLKSGDVRLEVEVEALDVFVTGRHGDGLEVDSADIQEADFLIFEDGDLFETGIIGEGGRRQGEDHESGQKNREQFLHFVFSLK